MNWPRLISQPLASIKTQVDRALGVSVVNGFYQLEHLDFDPQLFIEFPMKALFECFIGFTLTAGKLPHPAQVRVGISLSHEEFAIPKHKTRSDFNQFFHGSKERNPCKNSFQAFPRPMLL